jgi:hypothetical protein
MAAETRPTVDLAKVQGNTFSMLGMARVAMQRANWTPAQVESFTTEAMAGDVQHMLTTIKEHCDVR